MSEKIHEINLKLNVDEETRLEELFSFLNDIAAKCPNVEIEWSVEVKEWN